MDHGNSKGGEEAAAGGGRGQAPTEDGPPLVNMNLGPPGQSRVRRSSSNSDLRRTGSSSRRTGFGSPMSAAATMRRRSSMMLTPRYDKTQN